MRGCFVYRVAALLYCRTIISFLPRLLVARKRLPLEAGGYNFVFRIFKLLVERRSINMFSRKHITLPITRKKKMLENVLILREAQNL